MHEHTLNAESTGYCAEAVSLLSEAGELWLAEMNRRELLDSVSWATALIVRLGHRIDDEVLRRAPYLRVVVTATTGLDHIDLEAARRRNVTVLSLTGETDFLDTVHATAEHSWAMLLALVRRIPWAHQHTVAGGWQRHRFRGRELSGRRLGILGLGRVGRRVARYGLAFGMKVSAYDPAPGPRVTGVSHAAGLIELATGSDVLSVHVPLDESTCGLVDDRVLGSLPADAVLVNTSRGEVIDEDALAARLEDRTLGGAALDVLRTGPGATVAFDDGGTPAGGGNSGPSRPRLDAERAPPSRLLEMARDRTDILLTPRIGGATVESMARTEVFMAKKLLRFFRTPADGKSGKRTG